MMRRSLEVLPTVGTRRVAATAIGMRSDGYRTLRELDAYYIGGERVPRPSSQGLAMVQTKHRHAPRNEPSPKGPNEFREPRSLKMRPRYRGGSSCVMSASSGGGVRTMAARHPATKKQAPEPTNMALRTPPAAVIQPVRTLPMGVVPM